MKKLRKVLLIILAAAFFLLALVQGSKLYWMDVRAGAKPYAALDDLTQTELGTRYEISYVDHIAYVTFDENRQVVETDGVEPIHFDRKNFWGIWNYDAFVELYGKPHFHFGNIENAWVTDDGYIISMRWPGTFTLFWPITLQDSSLALAGEIYIFDLLAAPE